MAPADRAISNFGKDIPNAADSGETPPAADRVDSHPILPVSAAESPPPRLAERLSLICVRLI